MSKPGRNHLDHKILTLTPRDYLERPHTFGRAGNASWFVPATGTRAGLLAARRQHALARQWRESRTPTTGVIRAVFGISKQTWSRIVLGQRWAGQLGLEALLGAMEGRRY